MLLALVLLLLLRPPLGTTSTPKMRAAEAEASSCFESEGSAILLPRAVSEADIALLLAAERAAWNDSFLVDNGLSNYTRIIAGAEQSVTWLHRHREDAGGAIERAEAAAVGAQERAGWALASQLNGVRCIESIRYAAIGKSAEPSEPGLALNSANSGGGGDEGWHTDEWSSLTAVVVLSATADLRGGDFEIDRGGGPRYDAAPSSRSNQLLP